MSYSQIMIEINMELSDLKVFQQVVLSGGITAAAQKLNRVPSNITARIQKLELQLNTQLFLREKNRLRISPAGEHRTNRAADRKGFSRRS